MDLRILFETPPWDWPRDTGETLKKILKNRTGPPEADRVIAANLAGNIVVMNDEMAELLLSIVQCADDPAPLRAQAAISLGPALDLADAEGFEDHFSDPPITKATFDRIQEALRKTYLDGEGAPKLVRRRALEAAVRAQQDWQIDAIRTAYSSGDKEWMTTAVFGMTWIAGFDQEILQALESPNSGIRLEAVRAAGSREVDAAWPHVTRLVASKTTAKPLLLAAISAVASIRPAEASAVLAKLANSADEEIAEAASEAMLEASTFGQDFEDDEDDEAVDGYKGYIN